MDLTLPPDDFLRHLPKCLPPIERLRLETLVFAYDMIEVSFGRLVQLAHRHRTHNAFDLNRVAMLSDAWSIVDQVHVVRQVLTSLSGKKKTALGGDIKDYLDDFAAACVLRNKMDHLNQNLPNRAARSGMTNPMFGSVSFLRIDAGNWEQTLREGAVSGQVFFIGIGSAPEMMLGTAGLEDLDPHPPVCSFKLEAFDQKLLLERATFRLRKLVKQISDAVKNHVEAQLPGLIEKHGQPREILMQPEHIGLECVMDVTIEI